MCAATNLFQDKQVKDSHSCLHCDVLETHPTFISYPREIPALHKEESFHLFLIHNTVITLRSLLGKAGFFKICSTFTTRVEDNLVCLQAVIIAGSDKMLFSDQTNHVFCLLRSFKKNCKL